MEDGLGAHAQNDIENPSTPLVSSLGLELESLSPLSPECCIYRVPKRLRAVNEKAYTPQVVSIGPLHHGNDMLEPMEEHKKRYLSAYLERTNVGLEHYLNIIKQKEAELRSCYEELIGFSSDEFVNIVLVDAAFLIELLLRSCFPRLQDEADRIFNKPWKVLDIVPDMLLLENQLPFFILEDLFDPERISLPSHDDERLSIIKLSDDFFKEHVCSEGTEDTLERISCYRVEHFIDLLRKFYVPFEPKSEEGKLETLNFPSITELRRAGVKLKAKSSKNLLDIRFSKCKGILEIPKLTINDRTDLLIRNLIALEQCHCTEKESYMCSYVMIMDRLVNTTEDVDLPVKYGIFENHLGNCSEVATLINKLGDGVVYHGFYFAKLSEELSVYCRTSWHKWKANLKQKYFNTPWAIVSVIAAVVLILLTIIQTVCSIISVTAEDAPPH